MNIMKKLIFAVTLVFSAIMSYLYLTAFITVGTIRYFVYASPFCIFFLICLIYLISRVFPDNHKNRFNFIESNFRFIFLAFLIICAVFYIIGTPGETYARINYL